LPWARCECLSFPVIFFLFCAIFFFSALFPSFSLLSFLDLAILAICYDAHPICYNCLHTSRRRISVSITVSGVSSAYTRSTVFPGISGACLHHPALAPVLCTVYREPTPTDVIIASFISLPDVVRVG
jgi:hypothetical protein